MKSNMKLRLASVLAVALALLLSQAMIVCSQPSSSVNAQLANTSSTTLLVPDNYPTIGAAIGNASQGDTILVKSGVYYENLWIDKPLVIKGENAENTIIIGTGGVERGARPVFTLAANNVELSGFTIQSINYSSATNYATGVKVAGDNCKITGNNIVGTYYGVFCSIQLSTTISQNNITATRKDSIRICGGSQNAITNNNITGNAQSGIALDGYLDTVTGNNIVGNGRGIGLGASYSVVFGNNLTGNTESGFYIAASNCIVSSNYIAQSKWGTYFTSFFAAPNNNLFYHNDFVDNTQNVGASSIYNSQVWDNGYPTGGNYWSNYNGTDNNNDNIGDTPYTVYANDADHYPLMTLYNASTQTTLPPNLPTPPATTNSTVALWHFDVVEPNGATPDATGNNPAVLEPAGETSRFNPVLVEGKFDNALKFNGTDYVYVTSSPSLEIQEEITIDAWVNVQEFKNVAYNNIVVECVRTPDKFPTRIVGFAFNGEPAQNSSSLPQGALRGFVLDSQGVFNEIVTTDFTLPLNQWTHVVFIRSLTSGMHIYVNDKEVNVKVTSGVQNPTDAVERGTEFYIGHDSLSTLDEVSISTNAVTPQAQAESVVTQWWFWTAFGAGIAVLAGGIYFVKRYNGRRIAA